MSAVTFTITDILTPRSAIEQEDVAATVGAADQEALRLSIKAMPYMDFLWTPYWFYIRGLVIERAGRRCQMCGTPGKQHVHHRDYNNHGSEHRHLNDLICLCPECHNRHHMKMLEIRRKPAPIPLPAGFKACAPIPRQQEKLKKRRHYPAGSFVTVWCTPEMAKGCNPRKAAYHWLRDNGFKPQKRKWQSRMVGRQIPEWVVRGWDPFSMPPSQALCP